MPSLRNLTCPLKHSVLGLMALGMLAATFAAPVHAAMEPSYGTYGTDTAYNGTPEEMENINVYQQSAPAVVSINSPGNQGAGVILTADGLVVTNRHVIQDSREVSVTTSDGREYKAQLFALGTVNPDLAFLKIMSKAHFPYVRLGDSAHVKVGQRVLAIGSPFGLDGTLTTGIVSRIDHTRNMIQTDAAINPGNSGGALLNTRGELIGINRSIINPVGASSAGISFAVPVNIIRQELANIPQNTALAKAFRP